VAIDQLKRIYVVSRQSLDLERLFLTILQRDNNVGLVRRVSDALYLAKRARGRQQVSHVDLDLIVNTHSDQLGRGGGRVRISSTVARSCTRNESMWHSVHRGLSNARKRVLQDILT
jgi:hypothetical protein